MAREPVSPEDIEDQFNLVEAIHSRISSDDEYLAALLATQIQISKLERAQNRILEQLAPPESDRSTGKFPVDMSHNVPTGTQPESPNEVTRTIDEENSSNVTAITLGWQNGTNNVVGIQISTGDGLKLMPRNGQDEYLAFNDFTETFDLQYKLDPGESLVAKTVNLDTTNRHFVNIVPHITELVEDGS